MGLIEFFMDILGLISDIQLAKRYGWGSLMWNLAGIACLIITVLLFVANRYILGTIGIIGCIACFVMECRQFFQDLRSKREYEAWKREQEKKKES